MTKRQIGALAKRAITESWTRSKAAGITPKQFRRDVYALLRPYMSVAQRARWHKAAR